jgi:uncharacterized protein YggE
MKKSLTVVAVFLCAVLILGLAGCDMYGDSSDAVVTQAIQSNQDVGISVTGTGEIDVTPDVAVLNLGVMVQMDSLAQAQQQAVDSMDAIMSVLSGYSIADEDIQTVDYSIEPVWTWKDSESVFAGYKVTNTVNVRIRDMDGIGEIIDDAVDAGGEYVVVNGVTFTIDEPEAYYEDARTAAMADAKEKATQLAKSAGVKVGTPISIYESEYYSTRTSGLVYAEMDGNASTSISSGQLTVTVTVQVVYTIG